MLRISIKRRTATSIGLTIEGKLLVPWIAELKRECDLVLSAGKTLELDLSRISYADGAGLNVLENLIYQGVVVIAISPFIAELLKERLK